MVTAVDSGSLTVLVDSVPLGVPTSSSWRIYVLTGASGYSGSGISGYSGSGISGYSGSGISGYSGCIVTGKQIGRAHV